MPARVASFIRVTLLLVVCAYAAGSTSPCQALLQHIATLADYAPLYCREKSVSGLNTCLQQHWKRNFDVERWEHTVASRPASPALLAGLKSLDILNQAVLPRNKTYTYAVLLGSTIRTMRERLSFLQKLYRQHGIRFQRIIMLGSDRPLDPTIESDAVLNAQTADNLKHHPNFLADKHPTTEAEGWQFIWQQAVLPAAWQNIPHEIINTYAKPTQRRAHTDDTIVALRNRALPNGTYLFVSSQPFVLYQALVIQRVLQDQYLSEVVGEHMQDTLDNPLVVSVYQDTLARIVYQIEANLAEGIAPYCPALTSLPQAEQ